MAGAMTATAGAAGIRAWLATRAFGWLTPKRLKAITIVLVAGALLATTVLVRGTTAASASRGQSHVRMDSLSGRT
ncbi:hypothetical protein [Conexibacter sp. CPCC 206217]|uniref:hypothetical protein n=1 Tax=Conexibacter sp. CPCC 206217 TaxID=3064574 RepID=UPI00272AE564|nr:hypothetical protein [Conexibacter sp. CPCC 206217]